MVDLLSLPHKEDEMMSVLVANRPYLVAVLRSCPLRLVRCCASAVFFSLCLSAAAGAGELTNLSTRGFVGTGEEVLIGGFVIEGSPTTVLIRAPGPSLEEFGIDEPLLDPVLTLFAGQTPIAENNDWVDSPQAEEILDTGLAPEDDFEPAILVTLLPGSYTAIVSGFEDDIGVALVEVFR
jgi:hypothetical protein